MAFQQGLIKLTGALGNAIYYKNRYGYLSRRRNGPSREKILHSPNFEGTRKHLSEFKELILYSKLLYYSHQEFRNSGRVGLSFNETVSLLRKIQKLDLINPIGKRSVINGLNSIQKTDPNFISMMTPLTAQKMECLLFLRRWVDTDSNTDDPFERTASYKKLLASSSQCLEQFNFLKSFLYQGALSRILLTRMNLHLVLKE